MKEICKIKFILLFIIINLNVETFGQFLATHYEERIQSVEVGILNNFFKPNNDFSSAEYSPLILTHYIPYIAYRNADLFLGLGFSSFDQNNKSFEELLLNAYYGTSIPLTAEYQNGLFLPLYIHTSYLKLFQKNNIPNNKFEVGEFGVGAGLKFNYKLGFANFTIHYLGVLNYSTVSFNIEYGYSFCNEAEILFQFNRVIGDYGLLLGLKYFDERWYLSDKKYNYFGSWAGGFIGINF
jgi:hypothetical protein